MTRFTEEQLKQQWNFSQMSPEQQQQFRNHLAQRASQNSQQHQQQHQQQQVSQPPNQLQLSPSQQQQRQHQIQQQQRQQLLRQQFNQLPPAQQQQVRQQMMLRQQQVGQQRPNPMQFPVQSFNNTQFPDSDSMAPTSSPNHTSGVLQPQTSPHSSPVSTVSSRNRLSGPNILMSGNGRQQLQNAARSSSINGTSIARPHASSPLSVPSPRAASHQNATMIRTSSNTPPSRNDRSPTLSGSSHMPTIPHAMQTQSGSPVQQRQQPNASNVPMHSQPSRMPPSHVAQYQRSPPAQDHSHAQAKQRFSPTQQGSPPLAGQKRQAADAPEGTRPADKRQNMMPQPSTVTHATPVHQHASPSRQPGAYRPVNPVPNAVASITRTADQERRERQAKAEAERRELQAKAEAKRRKKEQQAKAAEDARVAEKYRIAHAAALQREKDDKRREELRKDPSANYRHIHEVYKLNPLKDGELPNRYLTGLLANRSMPMDLDCDLALAIPFAKDHWDYYGQWPKDITRFADYERERRAKAKGQA